MSSRNIRHRIDLFVHRFKRYVYLSLLVVLPVSAVALAAGVELLVLRHGGRFPSPAAPPVLLEVWAETVGGLEPLARMVVVGVGFLTTMVAVTTVAVRHT